MSHNDLLSDSEQHSIHSLVSDYKDDLASVASEIACVEATLDELRSRRTTLVSHIHSCHLAIAPHRKLPDEMLVKIFMESAPDSVSIFFDHSKIQCSSPYNILLVCSRWKNIAQASWRLWNRLDADFRHLRFFQQVNFKEKAGIFFSRSGLLSISLAIHCDLRTREWQSSISQRMADLLLCSESRLTTLSVSPIEFLYSIPPGFFANLEAASVFANKPPTHKIEAFRMANRPREFTLMSCITGMYFFEPSRLLLPWSQLTTLHLPYNFASAKSH